MPSAKVFDLAKELLEHEQIHDVRASRGRLTVVHAPDEKNVQRIPESVLEHIKGVTEPTIWKPEGDGERLAERHTHRGTRNDPVLSPYEQTAGYELQFHLVE